METEVYSTTKGQIRSLHVADYVIFALTPTVSAAMGFYYAVKDRRRQNTTEFLLAGRRMHAVPVALSLAVTFLSALGFLGTPAEMYNYNTMYLWTALGFLFCIIGSSLIFVPFFYRLNLTSTFEYLEMRFNKGVRLVASLFYIFQMILYLAFVLYTPSVALNVVTGLDLWAMVVATGVVVTLYTALGGMKAVVATDSFQALLIVAGLLAIVIQGSIVNGGFVNAWNIATNRSRIVFDDFSLDPTTRHSFWSVVVGTTFFWLYLFGANQAQVQRAISCSSVPKAQQALWLSLPLLWLILGLTGLIGILMFAFYSDCHPVSFGVISKTDQLVPLFVMDILGSYPGLPGLFLACLFSGSLSTLSSGLSALDAVIMVDLVRPYCCPRMSELRSTVLSKLVVLATGAVMVAATFVVSQLGSVLQAAMSVQGAVNGPVFGLFLLGMFFPWANSKGALVGFFTSLSFLFWISIGAFINQIKTPLSPTLTHACNWTAVTNTTNTLATTSLATTNLSSVEQSAGVHDSSDPLRQLYSLSYMHYTGLGAVLAVVLGLLASFLTGRTPPSSLDPRLCCPLVDILLPCLPERIRRPLRCGVPYPETSKCASLEKSDPVETKQFLVSASAALPAQNTEEETS